nr:condensation domain-containing protein [Bacillus velezensis]
MRPFDLSQAPLLRAGLIELEQDRHVFMFDMHHIISDGASMNIFVEELIQLYDGKELTPLRIQYKDYTVWRRQGGAEGTHQEAGELLAERIS